MSDLTYKKLNESELALESMSVEGWTIEGGQLIKTYRFENYLEGPEFAMAVAQEAESLNHHPEMLIGYRTVRISVSTHDVGGLSPFDFELARRIDGFCFGL